MQGPLITVTWRCADHPLRELDAFQELRAAPQPWLAGRGSEINQGDDLEAQGEMLLVLLSKFLHSHALLLTGALFSG